MKVGDLVRWIACEQQQVVGGKLTQPKSGVVVEMVMKKHWRTAELGPKIDWKKIDHELHAVVVIKGYYHTLPAVDLEVISESR